MIQAMIFDLDGTLVQTEKLNALSYAKAAVSTPFTRERLHSAGLLPAERIVDDPERVATVAAEIVRQSNEQL